MIRITAVAVLLVLLGACSSLPWHSTASAPAPASKAPATATDLKELIAAADATREEGSYNDALQIYQQVLFADPGQKAAQYGAAESLLALSQAGAARPLFDGLIGDPGYHARALQGAGLSLLALGQPEKATKFLHDATEADPALWRSWNAQGTLADREKRTNEAQTLYARALAANPNSPAILNNIAYSRLIGGKSAAAVEGFRKALALDPKNETIQNNLRLALAANGNYADALRSVGRERMPSVLNDVGYVAMRRGDYAAAAGYLTRAMEDSSSYNAVAAKNLDQLKSLKNSAP
jgi:Flp pilus assembly protein TadD